MSQEFDPKKIIDFNKDYYFILGINKEDLPTSSLRQNKIEISKFVEQSFRKKARTCHPDFGGSNEAFLDLVRARRIIEDPVLRKIYDQGYFDELTIDTEKLGFDIDWSQIGNYRKGSPEDTTGFSLFFKICERKDELEIIPAFFPKEEVHNYEWDWVINEKDKLVLSIINDENEVLRLTSGENLDESLPFKIYICIPRSSLTMMRKPNTVLNPDGGVLQNGDIFKVCYNDFNLLETTNLNVALDYVNNKLKEDLIKFKNNELKPNLSSINDTKWLNSEDIRKYDNDKIKEIINLRKFEFQDNQKAADFIDKISNKNTVKRIENKPDLPL